MVRNPYNITLSSTKKTIFTILFVTAIIIAGFILSVNHGFNNTYPLAAHSSEYADGFSHETDLYVVNFIFALVVIIVALGIIVIRHDILGIISGLLLFLFIFFAFTVGCKYTSGGIAGVNKKEDMTLTVMLVDRINELKEK